MTSSPESIDRSQWRSWLARVAADDVHFIVAIQCADAWLEPAYIDLRDEIDEALAVVAYSGREVDVVRVLRHDVSYADDENHALARGRQHERWVETMSVVNFVSSLNERVHIHLLLPAAFSTLAIDDCLESRSDDAWPVGSPARNVLDLIATPHMATVVSGYDFPLHEPQDDVNPSLSL